MENYSKLVDDVLRKLDWEHIMKYYETHGEVEEPVKKGKRINVKVKNIHTVKKELRDLLRFVVDSNFSELQHDQWIIYWKPGRLEVIFTPTRIVCTENEAEQSTEDESLNSDEVERGVLKDMLAKTIEEENYELSAVIHSRLKKLEKYIKVSSMKKPDIY